MTGRVMLKAGHDYPETPRLKAARLAVVSAALTEDPDIETYRLEHRAALADAQLSIHSVPTKEET